MTICAAAPEEIKTKQKKRKELLISNSSNRPTRTGNKRPIVLYSPTEGFVEYYPNLNHNSKTDILYRDCNERGFLGKTTHPNLGILGING